MMTQLPLVLLLASCCCLFCFISAELRPEPKCSPEDEICEFSLVAQTYWSMMHIVKFGLMAPVVIADNGTFYARSKSCDRLIELNETEAKRVIIGDGRQKLVLTFNGEIPGPPIVVYEGQKVVVRVKNAFSGYVTTVHWHGQTMEGYQQSDGVPGVTQYPIPPRQTFTYRFRATRVGTFWYHSHQGSQRSEGAYGPLIVLPKPKEENQAQTTQAMEGFKDDFIMAISDWMHETSESIYVRLNHDNLIYPYGYDNDTCYSLTKGVDGLDVGISPFVSATVNGKGRHYPQSGRKPHNPNIPLEIFPVDKDPSGRIRFRTIQAADIFTFQVSIDAHDLHVFASDGNDLDPVTVQYLIISPGERYDFWIVPNDPTGEGSYWIRITTLEYTEGGQRIHAGHTEAILRYNQPRMHDRQNRIDDPKSSERRCSSQSPCKVLNCPFKDFPKRFGMHCIGLDQLRSTKKTPVLTPESDDDFVEVFLNYHFSGTGALNMFKPNINGKVFVPPVKPLLLQTPDNPSDVRPCNETLCAEEACFCTHQLDIPLNKVVQMVIFTEMPPLSSFITGTHHPVHLHGHHFEVLKMAYPSYDEETGLYKESNRDIECTINKLCNVAKWANASWENGNVPGIIQEGAPLKDTVQVPGGGYVVIRFKSTNPGFWLMHCHVEMHNIIGMTLVVKEGKLEDMHPGLKSLPSKDTKESPPGLKQTNTVLLQIPQAALGQSNATISVDSAIDDLCKGELSNYLVAITIFSVCNILLFIIFLRLALLEFCNWPKVRKSGLSSSGQYRGSGSHRYETQPLLT